METNANAELAMRVKALESDVAALQRRVMSQETLRALVDEVKELRAQR